MSNARANFAFVTPTIAIVTADFFGVVVDVQQDPVTATGVVRDGWMEEDLVYCAGGTSASLVSFLNPMKGSCRQKEKKENPGADESKILNVSAP